MDKILTISVASYNLGSMIEQNLESFCSCQNKQYLEVLVINDGSNDNTEELAKKFEQKYPEVVKVITGAGTTGKPSGRKQSSLL